MFVNPTELLAQRGKVPPWAKCAFRVVEACRKKTHKPHEPHDSPSGADRRRRALSLSAAVVSSPGGGWPPQQVFTSRSRPTASALAPGGLSGLSFGKEVWIVRCVPAAVVNDKEERITRRRGGAVTLFGLVLEG